jgi:hypothetical protein
MINIFVNYEKEILLNVNPYISIFHLKTIITDTIGNPTQIQLLFNGHILDDNKTLIESKILNNSVLFVSKELLGGFDSFSMLLILGYIVCVIIYIILLISGLLPIASMGYDYLLNMAIKWLYSFIAVNPYIKTVISIILFAIRIFSIFIFLYITSTFIIYPIVYYFKSTMCPTLKISKDVGYIIAIAYIITYIIFSIPDMVYTGAEEITQISPLFKVVLSPILRQLRNIIDDLKFAVIYAIPLFGSPFVDGYHLGIDVATGVLNDIFGVVGEYGCDKQTIDLLANAIVNYETIAPLKAYATNSNLTYALDILPIALIPKLKEYYKCEVDKLPFWDKMNPLNRESMTYYASIIAYNGLCTALNTVKTITDFTDYSGGTQVIANAIKTGNIAGIFTLILAPFIALILWLMGSFND